MLSASALAISQTPAAGGGGGVSGGCGVVDGLFPWLRKSGLFPSGTPGFGFSMGKCAVG